MKYCWPIICVLAGFAVGTMFGAWQMYKHDDISFCLDRNNEPPCRVGYFLHKIPNSTDSDDTVPESKI